MKFKIIILLIVFISKQVLAVDLKKEIAEILNSQSSRPFNGVILIAKGKESIYERAKGAHSVPKINSQFVVASISKQITATIILELVDRGLIRLEDPISLYLPELKQKWAKVVNIKQLLNHTSGIVSLNEPLAFKPGVWFKYSPSVTYYLLSRVAEKVSGEKYETVLKNLFYKTNMKNSAMASSRSTRELYEKNPNLIHGYKEQGDTVLSVASLNEGIDLKNNKWIHPGRGVISSAHDLLNWNLALHRGRLLSKKTYRQMIAPQTKRDHARYGEIGYGFGVQVVEKDSPLEISHSGYVDGYVSTLIYYPVQQVSVVVLENISWDISNVRRVFSIHDQIREVVLSRLVKEKKE